MPKLRPETEKLLAQNLTKTIVKSKFNQREAARRLGIKPQTLNEKFHRPAVQDALQKFLDSKLLKKTLIDVAIDGLKAEKSISAAILVQKDGTVVKADDEGGIMIPDHNARHKYWHDLLTALGKLKLDDNGGVKIINIIHGYRRND